MRIAITGVILSAAWCVTSCSGPLENTTNSATNFLQRQQVTATTKHFNKASTPSEITYYSQKNKPFSAYRVIGTASVSKYNILGYKRSDQTVQNMMKKLAASIGGDGLIELRNQPETSEASVIQFQKIMI